MQCHLGAGAFERSAIWARGHLGAVPLGREIRSHLFCVGFLNFKYLIYVCNDLIK